MTHQAEFSNVSVFMITKHGTAEDDTITESSAAMSGVKCGNASDSLQELVWSKGGLIKMRSDLVSDNSDR